ncbi:MAG: flagellar protein FliS [Pseudomonadota bacterium]|jgi:flagellar protein FliS
MLHRDAIKAYQEAEQDFLVEGADQHSLVQILYGELLNALDHTHDALERLDLQAKSASMTKALSIIHVLNSTLDFEKGGEVAASLAQLYEWARRKVIEASRTNVAPIVKEVRKVIAEIADAWDAIGRTGVRAA